VLHKIMLLAFFPFHVQVQTLMHLTVRTLISKSIIDISIVTMYLWKNFSLVHCTSREVCQGLFT